MQLKCIEASSYGWQSPVTCSQKELGTETNPIFQQSKQFPRFLTTTLREQKLPVETPKL